MIFYLKNKTGDIIASAELVFNSEKKTRKSIIVMAGSKMSKTINETKKWLDCPWIEKSRQKIISDGFCNTLNSTHYVLTRDVLFSSPNRAACALLGYITTSAWHEFVNESGVSLHTIYREG